MTCVRLLPPHGETTLTRSQASKMLAMDKTSEKLRSKHVRTLELLQKTLDENVELRDQIGRLKKVRASHEERERE